MIVGMEAERRHARKQRATLLEGVIRLMQRINERKISMKRPQPIRLLLIVLVALCALASQTHAFASQSVDTSLLYPALGSDLSWTCQATGTDVICRATTQFSDSFGDTGLPCGSGTIYEAGTG